MVGAHTTACCWPVREHGGVVARRRRRSEGGFTLIELLVVLIIVAILFAMILPQLGTTRQKTGAPLVNVAGGAVWRGVQAYRLENGGVLPPATLLAGAHLASPPGNNWINPGSGRYVNRWPSDTRGGAMQVLPGTGATPPDGPTTLTTQRGRLVYSAVGTSGWLVGYSDTGAMVYRRAIGPSGARPIG